MLLSKLFHRSPRRSCRKSQNGRTRFASLEPLEKRELFVVGAFSPAPALADSVYSGVVELEHFRPFQGNTGCSGTLLETGRHILTAAHCLTDGNGNVNSVRTEVSFRTPSDTYTLDVRPEDYSIHPSWRGGGDGDSGYDIAVLTLPAIAPSDATRFELYRDTDEVGSIAAIVGYGQTGTGDSGARGTPDGERRIAWNHIEGTSYDNWYQSGRGGPDGTVLWYDFDSTLRTFEGMAAPGDSGGPLFIDNQIAGVHSAAFETRILGGKPEFEFGEDSTATRVSVFADWIDSVTSRSQSVVLDMREQPDGGDGVADVITMRNDGSRFIEIFVNGTMVSKSKAGTIRSLELKGSTDDDTFELDFAVYNIDVWGNSGNDILQGPDSPTDWQILGAGRGGLGPLNWSPRTNYRSIENLQGGSSTDRFFLLTWGGVRGDLDGGGGRYDTLDYGAGNVGVNVDLASGRATGVFGEVAGIENVRGSAGDDVIRGDSQNNYLDGRGGNDRLIGGGGNDTLMGRAGDDSLFGGHGADRLYGGADEDYLDGGYDSQRDEIRGGGERDTIVRHHYEPSTVARLRFQGDSRDRYRRDEFANYDQVFSSPVFWQESQIDDYVPDEDVLVQLYWDRLGSYHHHTIELPTGG